MKTIKGSEWMICAAVAVAGFAVGTVLQGPANAGSASASHKEERTRLTAILPQPGSAAVRRLLRSGTHFTELWTALDGCSNEEFAEHLGDALSQPHGYLAAQVIIAKWCQSDPAAAATAASEANYPNPVLLYSAIEQWAETAPQGAMEFLAQHPSQSETRGAYFALFQTVVRQEDPNFSTLLEQLPPEQQQVRISMELRHLAQTDPMAALEEFQKIRIPSDESSTGREGFAYTLSLMALRAKPASEIIEVFDRDATRSLGEPPPQLVLKFYQQDPQAAVAWLNDPGSPRRATLHGTWLANVLADSKPDQAAAILTQLPTGESRSKALAELASKWHGQDAGAASAWAATLGQGDRELVEKAIGEDGTTE